MSDLLEPELRMVQVGVPLPDGEVNLRAQRASGASELVVSRLDGNAAGRFLPQVRFFDVPAAC